MNNMTGWQLYQRMLKLLKGHTAIIVLAITGMALYAAASGLMPVMVGVITRVFEQNDLGNAADLWWSMPPVIWLPLLIFGLFLLRGIGSFLSIYFFQRIASQVVFRIRTDIFNHLVALPVSYFDRQSSGAIVARLTFNVDQISRAVTNATTGLVREGLTVVFTMAALLYTNWQLTLILISVTPVVVWVVNSASTFFRRYSKRLQQSVGNVAQVANEVVPAMRVVKIFARQEYERDRFRAFSERNKTQSNKIGLTKAISTPTVQTIIAAAMAVITAVALIMHIESAVFIQFLTAALVIAKPVKTLTTVNQELQTGLAAAEDIYAQLDLPEEYDLGAKVQVTKVEGRVEVRHLTFEYVPNTPVLNDISFAVEPGQTLALVGRSGSGKSTLMQLLPRFYQGYQGAIELDGTDTRDMSLADLRDNISLVTQNTVLFAGSIRDNIRYGCIDATDEQVVEAARRAHVIEFAQAMPDGLDTMIGDNGVTLSGGQRQRVAIARAIIKQAPIMILDEATSALDTESERYIQETMSELSGQCTTIVIAHRLSTIEQANHIVVMDAGEIVEQGTHESLLKESGYYAKLIRMQSHDDA